MNDIYLKSALEQLEIVGLSQKIFLAILNSNNKLNISTLIQELGTTRATFYKSLKNLEEQDLVYKNQQDNWQTISIDKLYSKLRVKQVQLNQITSSLESNLDYYKQLYSSPKTETFVSVYSGSDQVKEQALLLAHTLSEDYIGFGDSYTFENLIGLQIQDYWISNRKRLQIKLRLLLQNKELVDFLNLEDEKEFRETRYLKSEFPILGYFNIHKNTAFCWSPQYDQCTVVSDLVFVSSLRAIFETLWCISE